MDPTFPPDAGPQHEASTPEPEATVCVPCNLCGAANRVPHARLGERARCGRCMSHLMAGTVAATSATRLARVLGSTDLTVLVQVTSDRIPSERRRDPVLDGLARDLRGDALVYRVDADREPGVLDALGLTAVPSLAVAIGGRVVSAVSGGLEREALDQWLAGLAVEALHG